MSNKKNENMKENLISSISQEVQAFQEATDAFDEAAAKQIGLNRTDMRLLSILGRNGNMTLGALSKIAGLSKAAMTTAIDRIEKVGYAQRKASDTDRRSTIVCLTKKAHERIKKIWGPLGTEGICALEEYSIEELEIIFRFLKSARSLNEKHSQRILSK